jgi:hypothetical protein
MKLIRKALLTGAFLFSLSIPLSAQVKYGVVLNPAASVLAKAFNDTEDAFCVVRDYRFQVQAPSDTAVQVLSVVHATVKGATTDHIESISCPDTTLSVIHTHPHPEGVADCNPSRTDWQSFAYRGEFYEAIVCGSDGSIPIVRFYFQQDNPLTHGTAEKQKKSSLRRDLFLTPLVLGSAFIRDPDAGGYVDRWGTQDKAFHFTAGFSIALAGLKMGAPAKWVIPGTCAAAAIHELKQQYHSRKDFAASCGGAVLAWAWNKVWK